MKTCLGIFFFIAALTWGTPAIANDYPSESDLDGIIKGCAIGLSKGVQMELAASIKSWRKAAAKGRVSYDELGGILAESPDGKIDPKVYKTYTDCILSLIKEYRTGSSSSDYDKKRAEIEAFLQADLNRNKNVMVETKKLFEEKWPKEAKVLSLMNSRIVRYNRTQFGKPKNNREQKIHIEMKLKPEMLEAIKPR